ncbi:MAG: alkaline phosphatase D family protein [Micropepsaceae bacterium]
MVTLHRRDLLKTLAGFAGTYLASAAGPANAAPIALTTGRYRFPQGVASGDPRPDGIVLWTRVEASDLSAEPVNVRVQIARTPDFTQVVLDEMLVATAESDHTLRLVVQGLDADTVYFYRFLATGDQSRLGRTRTAPMPDVERPTRFVFACCQNFEQGFYGAWARMIADDITAPTEQQIDFVLFLGDFIYEVRGDRWDSDMHNPKWLKGADGRERFFPPFPNGSTPWPPTDWNKNGGATNAVTVADYRFLYRLYLSDANLQTARARWPFVSIWDDHEFTNDSWQAHDTYFGDGGKPAQKRKVAASQAWFEYVPAMLTGLPGTGQVANPARDFKWVDVNDSPYLGPSQDWIDPNIDNRNALNSITIYRTLRWGKTIELILTDNRSYKSPPPKPPKIDGQALPGIETVALLDQGRSANAGDPPVKIPGTDIDNPRRTAPPGSVLGPAQKAWFKDVLTNSDARWKIWANSFPALPVRMDLGSIWFAGIKNSKLGVDGWNGYPSELTEIMTYVRDNGVSNLVACAGDHHMHMAGLLIDDPDAEITSPVAVEFATAGISSEPVFGGAVRASTGSSVFHSIVTYQSGNEVVENMNLALLGGVNAAIVRSWTGSSWLSDAFWNERASPGLKYVDTNSNGYGVMSVNAGRIEANLVTIENPEKDYGPQGSPIVRKAKFTLRAWSPGQTPELVGPVFQGKPAFPFE